MDAESNRCLTGYQITRLASNTSAKDMEFFAGIFMYISYETIKNFKYETRSNVEAFNRCLIRYWARKNQGPEHVQVTGQEKY